MTDLVRLSFSIDHSLAESFEELVRTSAYGNRSEFFRDMVRDLMVSREWQDAQESDDVAEAVGTITLVYDHHARGLDEKLTDLQHDHHHMVLATTHVHLDHHLCAEVIICRGRPLEIRSMCDSLRQQKGVLHGALTMSSTGWRLAGERGEE